MKIFTEVDERVGRQFANAAEVREVAATCPSEGCTNPPHPQADGYCAPCMVKMAEEWDREFWILEVEKRSGV